jgi:hypothetical protein
MLAINIRISNIVLQTHLENNFLVLPTKTKNMIRRREIGIHLVKEVLDVAVNVLLIYLKSKTKTEVV